MLETLSTAYFFPANGRECHVAWHFAAFFGRRFYVLFQKRVRGFHQVTKREKTFYCFRAFGNLMKPEARVFEITSLTKKINFNYHFNEFFELKYCFWQAEFECVTYLLLTGICHLLAACWPLIILNFVWICIPQC